METLVVTKLSALAADGCIYYHVLEIVVVAWICITKLNWITKGFLNLSGSHAADIMGILKLFCSFMFYFNFIN